MWIVVVAALAALVLVALVVVFARRRPAKAPDDEGELDGGRVDEVSRRHWLDESAPIDRSELDEPLEGVVPHDGPTPRQAPLPVVLVHGLFGFDRMGLPGARVDYFRGIAKHLESLGCHVHAVRLPRAASVPARAKKLVELIEKLPHDRIDLVAHSLGGLDARYALAHLGLASRVRSLVTIGTPHRGSPIANFFSKFGLPLMPALDWLTTEAAERFNREVPDAPNVRYACVVGGMLREDSSVPLPLMAAHAYLKKTAGTNDGIVPVSSQVWGEVLAEIEADHFAQVGWRITLARTFDAAGLYAFVVARLGDMQPERVRGVGG